MHFYHFTLEISVLKEYLLRADKSIGVNTPATLKLMMAKKLINKRTQSHFWYSQVAVVIHFQSG